MAMWHYSRQGQIFGPFTSDQLRDLVKQGKVLPDDLVCREGDAKWRSARRIAGLFPDTPAEPGKPASGEHPWFAAAKSGPVPLKPVAPPPVVAVPPEAVTSRPTVPIPLTPLSLEKESPSPVSRLLALPKPVLFGLFGGVGGLLGALLLGELLWLILSPTGLRARPHLQLGVPANLRIYAGGKNRFLVKVARRGGFKDPVVVEAVSTPNEVRVLPVQIAPGEDQAEVEVQITDGIPLGPTPITLQVRSLGDKPIDPVSATVNVQVEPMPPGLAVSVSPRVSVDQGGRGRFTARLARARFREDVVLRFAGLPSGVSLPEKIVPAEKTDATIDVAADASTPLGESSINVTATTLVAGKQVTNTTKFDLVVNKRPIPTVDVVFLLDLTGSMQFAINGIRNGIQNFVEQMGEEKLDAQVGVLCFRDIEADKEQPFMLQFDGSVFTKDYRAIRAKVAPLRASGGGDEPESSLQALDFATQQPFRPKAARVLVLITDASAKIHNLATIQAVSPREKITTIDECIEQLKKSEIDQLHLMIRQKDLDGSYRKFKDEFTGEFFDIQNSIRKGANAFADLLPRLSKEISRITVAAVPKSSTRTEPPPLPTEQGAAFPPETAVPVLKAVQSTEAYDARDNFRLLVAIVVWTMVVAAAISLFIVAGQHFHSRQSLVGFPEGGRGFAGGLVAGLAGGAVGQLVFQSLAGWGAAMDSISRILGWSLLGGLIGVVMAFFVPNLKWSRGMLGGFVGGVLGALAFVLISPFLGGLLGRWTGATILGFFIGLMVALAELAFRRFWLEIAVSAREVRTVTLGTSTVAVGGDEKLVSFFIAGAPAVALRYRIDHDRVLCEDATTGETTEVVPGDRRTVGRVAITVCSPASSRKTGYTLQLSSGKALLLQEGMPLTAEDLPGLEPRGQDGIVALVSRHPTQPQQIQLRNRSGQSWAIRTADGGAQVVEAGRAIELAPGVQVNFGQVHGSIRADEGG